MAIQAERTVRRLGGTLGAEVAVDLTQMDEETFEFVHSAFLEHCVLVFRNQDLDPASQVAFAEWFGDLWPYPPSDRPAYPELAAYPQVRVIENMFKGKMGDGKMRRVTEVWHPDLTWHERPPAHVVLASKVLPEAGGDTLFANQYAAYDALSDGLREMLTRLNAVHEPPDYYPGDGDTSYVHPVVIRHPETGRRVLYVSINAVRRFEGMTEAESRGLLQFLFAHQVSPEFVYRHRWLPGDVVMWDNRCTQHYAVDDYGDAPRVLFRATVISDTPPAA